MPEKTVWFDKGTLAIAKDYQKKTKQSFSKTIRIMITNFVRYGLEDTYTQERAIEAYRALIKEKNQQIAELEIREAELILKLHKT